MNLLKRLGLRTIQDLGMKVEIRFSETSHWPGEKQVLRNVTEIHYRYPGFVGQEGTRIAFESDVHCIGITHPLFHIDEFEVETEDTKAARF